MPDNPTNYVINNGFAVEKIKHMKIKSLAIHLILISFLSVLLPACASFQTPADAEIKPIKVTLLNTSYNRQTAINTRQTVTPNTGNSPSNIAQAAPVRLDNVSPPAYYTGNTDEDVTFTTPNTSNTPSEVRLQPAPATEFNFPSEDSSMVSSTPETSTPITPSPVTTPSNSVIIDNNPPPAVAVTEPDPIAAVLAAQQPASTNDSDTAVSVTVDTPTPVTPLPETSISTAPPIVEPPASSVVESTPPPAVIVDTVAENTTENVTPPTSSNGVTTIADSNPPPVIVDTQAPAQNTAPQEVSTGVVAAQPSLNKLTPAEQVEAEQTVTRLIAQADLAAMTAYINQYELDFGRYPYVQRVRVVRDQRCRETAVGFLSKGQTAFMEAYGQWCPRSSFTQAAR